MKNHIAKNSLLNKKYPKVQILMQFEYLLEPHGYNSAIQWDRGKKILKNSTRFSLKKDKNAASFEVLKIRVDTMKVTY